MKKILTVLVSAVLLAGLAGLPAMAAEEGPKYGQEVGDTAKPVDLKTFDGEGFNTGKLTKKTMFVFVNSVCSMCAREMRDLDKYSDKFAKADVYLVAVDMNLERVAQKYKKYAEKFGMLHDPEFVFGEAVGLYSTPATLVVEKDGKITYKKSGYRPEVLKEVAASL